MHSNYLVIVFSDASMNTNGKEFVNLTVMKRLFVSFLLQDRKNNTFLLLNMSKFSFITTVRAFMLTSPGCFPSVVCLCDLDRGFNQLSDLLTLQLGFWLQEHWGGGGCEVSHGVVVDGCREGGVHQGLNLFSQFCFPKRFPTEFPVEKIQTVKATELLWQMCQLFRVLYWERRNSVL